MSKSNGYVPIDKNLIQELNNLGRSFTRLEAMFSYSVDQNNGKGGSINGYAQLWNWSRNKTRKFLKEIRTVKGHQKDSRRTPNGQAVHFIDGGLWVSRDSERTVKGHQKDSERYTTINLNPESNKKDLKTYCASFLIFWNAYPKKKSKGPAEKAWKKLNPDEKLREVILTKIEDFKKTEDWQKDNGQFIPYPASWLNARGWEDEISIKKSWQEEFLEKHKKENS